MKKRHHLLLFALLCAVAAQSQVQRPSAWLRADSAVLNAPSWVDVSGNGLNATPSSGSMPAAFSRMNFNKCFEVGGAETFTLPLGINDSRQYEPPAGKVSYMYVLRNDTIFWLEIYKTDSIVVRDTNIAIGNGWWLMLSPNNENIVMRRFRRIHSSQDLKKIKEVIIAESEMQMTRFLKYNKELMLCQYFWRMGHLAYSSGEIKQPKRRMRKKLMNSYIKYANTTH